MTHVRTISTVEFQPLVAPALANRRGTRQAIEVVVDGRPLSEALNASPLDRETVQSMPQAKWFGDGELWPLVCSCGDPHCADVATLVQRDGALVRWTLPNGRTIIFEADSATESLRAALRE